jgi:hypothetical protein
LLRKSYFKIHFGSRIITPLSYDYRNHHLPAHYKPYFTQVILLRKSHIAMPMLMKKLVLAAAAPFMSGVYAGAEEDAAVDVDAGSESSDSVDDNAGSATVALRWKQRDTGVGAFVQWFLSRGRD